MQIGAVFASANPKQNRHTSVMKIWLEYMAMIQVVGPASGQVREVAEGTTAGALLFDVGIPPKYHPVVSVFINDTKVVSSRMLAEGDRVFLSIPLGGG
jgi:sulfur carrier protein ThiS